MSRKITSLPAIFTNPSSFHSSTDNPIPFWWAAIKAVTAVILGVWVVMAIALAIAGDQVRVPPGDPSLVGALVFAFGAVTLVCALIERFGKAAFLQKWKPSQLPPAGGKTKSRFERVVEIGMGGVFILWWTGAIQFRNVLPDHQMSVELAPIWRAMYWPILAYSSFEIGANVLGLFMPGRVVFNRVMSLARNLFGVVIVSAVYRAGHYLVVNWDLWAPQVRETVQANFDLGMRIGLGVTILIFVALAAVDLWRLWQAFQARRGPGAPRAARR